MPNLSRDEGPEPKEKNSTLGIGAPAPGAPDLPPSFRADAKGVSAPKTVEALVVALMGLGFYTENDSPGSGVMRFDFPEADGRYILVSDAVGGWIPTTDAAGACAGLYDREGEPLIQVGGYDEQNCLPTAEVQITEVMAGVRGWLETARESSSPFRGSR